MASGQTCVSGTRLIVQDAVYDEFVARFLEKVASITRRIGDRELQPAGSKDLLMDSQLPSYEPEVDHGNSHILTASRPN